MLVRLEATRDDNVSLVIDEIDRFIGEITDIDFIKCMQDKETTEIDGELYYTVDKEKIIEFCKK